MKIFDEEVACMNKLNTDNVVWYTDMYGTPFLCKLTDCGIYINVETMQVYIPFLTSMRKAYKAMRVARRENEELRKYEMFIQNQLVYWCQWPFGLSMQIEQLQLRRSYTYATHFLPLARKPQPRRD